MFELISRDRIIVQFTGAEAGTAPLAWGQQAIWQDMQDSDNQFNMDGMASLPDGSTVEAAFDTAAPTRVPRPRG
jgi:hypothetical protein